MHYGRKIPAVKHGGRIVMGWGCFAALGPGQFIVVESTMNSALCQSVLDENVRPTV